MLLRRVRLAILWTLWVFLAVVWIATLAALWTDERQAPAVLAFLDVLLLVVLYFAEGIELAVTDLLDKEPSQLHDALTRRLLSEIQARSGFFFAHRQIFVVVIISVLSLTTAYSWLYLPFYGRVDSPLATFWFSLVFTTLTVLWFCQVTPKRLAVINSERFLRQSAPIWRAINAISWLGLPDPADQLVRAIQRNSEFSESRYLLPGRATHYDISTHLLGFSLDRLATEVTIGADGSGEVRKRFLMLFLRGRHASVYGSLGACSSFAGEPTIHLAGIFLLPAAERIETITESLDPIFESAADPNVANLVDQWAGQAKVTVSPAPSGNGQTATWSIEGSPLPESLWPPDALGGSTRSDAPPQMVVLSFEVRAQITAGGFDTSGGVDQCAEEMSLPCRRYSISVASRTGAARPEEIRQAVAIGGCDVTFTASGTNMPEESHRVMQSSTATKGVAEIRYPLQGARYALWWRIFG
jgi:hypothetical protein